MLSTMSGVCIEDDALRFTFFMGGICMIANTAAIMSKSILKLYLNQVTHLKKYTRPPAAQVQRENKSTTQYDDHANLFGGNSDAGHMYLRNRKAPLMKLCNSSNHKLNQESVSKKDLVVKSSDPPLIRLLFVSCIIESICVMLSGIDRADASEQFSTCCNNSSQTKDCITFNTIVVLQKQCVLPFLCTLMICALSTFPISFLFTKHCFISWSRCIVSSTIFVFAILLSRCFGFLFLPHLLQGQMQSYLFQRLLLSWIVFFFMCLGICLTKHPVPTIHTQTANLTSDMDHTDKDLIEQYENFDHESQSTKMSTEQTNSILKPSKRIMRRSISDLAFTSDAFMPCVVLMKKHMPSMYKPHLNIGTMPKDRPARVRRRASLDVIKEHNSVIEARKWSDMMERRRTSLPAILASSKRKAVMSSVLVDTATLVDVQGTLEELASNPGNAEELVKKLQVLLKPYKTDHIKPRQVVWLHDSTTDGSDEDSAGTCMSPRHMGKRPSSRRPDWPGASGDIFSTTTTATGLPTEEPAPGNPKRIPKVKKEKTPVNSPFESHSGSPTCDGPLPSGMGRRQTFPTLQEQITTTFFPSANVSKQNRTVLSSDYESGDTDDSPSRCRSKSVNEADDSERTNSDRVSPTAPDHAESYSSVARVNNHSPLSDDNRVLAMSDERCRNESDDDGCAYFDDYQGKLLESVHNWNFQIFDLSEGTPNVLSQMAFKLFQDTGLFDTFKIPKQEFVKYMMTLERGYQQIPYHNRIHAADVLHGCWFLSTQDIPGFQDYYPLSSSDSSDSDSGTGASHTRHVNNIGHGSLAQAIPALELMALYLAASMHDFEHPGRTNAFLVETRHPLAILYNDRSVLENHHASASWNLLYSNKNFDFLKNLTTAEWKRLRFLIVEAILATDLKKHREILSQFTAKSQRPRQPSDDDSDCNRLMKTGINWSADEDRLLVCQMVIKLADIGGPAKSRHLHITWTKAICEEFFLQGDEERELGVPVSPFMDREHPQVAELQRTFIINLIKTMIVSMHKTGILAGALAGDEDDTIEGGQSPKSLLLEQLKDNLGFWKLNNYSSGHEEMVEAFKLALPVNLSLIRRKFNNQPSAKQAITVTHSSDQPPYYDVTKGKDDANDDVFSKKTASRQNKRFHDVISTSSKTLKSPPSQEKSRPQSKLQQPKTVVNRTALQRPTRK